MITVLVPPQRLGWLRSAMDGAGIPYRIDRDQAGQYNIETYQMAAPIIEQVIGHKPKAVNPFPMDVRVIGFIASLVLVVAVFVQSANVEPIALDAGVNPLVVRAAMILVIGAVVTVFISEGLLRDSRRWLFVLGMMGLFLAAALWFGLIGLGMPLDAELARWVR